MATTNEQFVSALLQVAPDFEPQNRGHVGFNEELLPHLLMGDFTRWFIELGRRATDVTKLASFLDESYQTGDDDVRELLSVSFLENLYQAGDDYALVRTGLGPILRQELRRYE